jgi:hypothetical protein
VLVHSGHEIVPGVDLRSVSPDAVIVRDATGEHRLELPSRSAGSAGAPVPSAPSGGAAAPAGPRPAGAASVASSVPGAMQASRGPNVPPARANACDPPAGFRGEVVRLNVELVGGLIAQPEVWRSLVEPSRGALVVRETAGFAQMVGLQQGDRLEQANGIALKVPDDLVGAVLRPLTANQPVHLVGERAGNRREVYVVNAGCGR